MEHYTKVQRPKEETKENEIKVAAMGQVPRYLAYAFRILKHSDQHSSITIRASNQAIAKAMQIVELIKRKIGNLHQINRIQTIQIVDRYESTVEGLEPQEITRNVTAYDCILSKEPLDTTDIGYQAPKAPEEASPIKPVQKTQKPKPKPDQTKKVTTEKPEHVEPQRGRGVRGRGVPKPQRRYNDDMEVAVETKQKRQLKQELDIEQRLTAPPRQRGRGQPMRGNPPMREVEHELEERQALRGRGRARGDHYIDNRELGYQQRQPVDPRGPGPYRGGDGRARDDFYLAKRGGYNSREDRGEVQHRQEEYRPHVYRGEGAIHYSERAQWQAEQRNSERYYQERQEELESRRGVMMRGRARGQPEGYFYQREPRDGYYEPAEDRSRYQEYIYDQPPPRRETGRGMRAMPPQYEMHPEERRRHFLEEQEYYEDQIRIREGQMRVRAGRGEVRMRGAHREGPEHYPRGHLAERGMRGDRKDRGDRGHRGDYQASYQRRYNDELSDPRTEVRDSNAPLRGHRGSRGSYRGRGGQEQE